MKLEFVYLIVVPFKERQKLIGKRKRAATLKTLHNKIAKLNRVNHKLQTKVWRVEKANERLKKKLQVSPATAVSKFLRGKSNSPEVKRRLIFLESYHKDVCDSFSIRSKKEKRIFAQLIAFSNLKKYKFMTKSKPIICLRATQFRRSNGEIQNRRNSVVKFVRKFFESDEASTMAPGKKDFITRNGVRKQKRYLNQTLKNLWQKFCNSDSPIIVPFTTFCKFRPFWLVWKKPTDRDTCLCVKHENMLLMVKQLLNSKILAYSNDDVEAILQKDMCCGGDSFTEDCLLRTCSKCKDYKMLFQHFDENKMLDYETWTTESTDRGSNITIKKSVSVPSHELVTKFTHEVPRYLQHVGRIKHQYRMMKKLKHTLGDDEILVHIDFSENFQCKYAREIQSLHFGGSRSQISLHTGVIYTSTGKKSFCTVADDLRHDPIAIYTHLLPILNNLRHMKKVHFLSDSPTTQYRSKKMFYLIWKKIPSLFDDLQLLTWNYSEAGHGKGAPDGIGAVVKRTCDSILKYNYDVGSFTQFLQVLKETMKTIQITVIEQSSFENSYQQLGAEIQGTTTLKGK